MSQINSKSSIYINLSLLALTCRGLARFQFEHENNLNSITPRTHDQSREIKDRVFFISKLTCFKQDFRNYVVKKMTEATFQKDGRCFEAFRRINVLARK